MSEVKRILIEFFAVGVFCLAIGFVANSLNTYGLNLSKNYIPPKAEPNGNLTTSESDPHPIGSNFQSIQHEEVVELFNDPDAEGFLVIIDARKKDLYEEGHIRGAYHFDPWRLDQYPQSYMQEIKDVCMAAGKVVCYCEGGDCEDSDAAAAKLADLGIDYMVLCVYTGGYDRWIEDNMPVEIGEQNSGRLKGGQ